METSIRAYDTEVRRAAAQHEWRRRCIFEEHAKLDRIRDAQGRAVAQMMQAAIAGRPEWEAVVTVHLAALELGPIIVRAFYARAIAEAEKIDAELLVRSKKKCSQLGW